MRRLMLGVHQAGLVAGEQRASLAAHFFDQAYQFRVLVSAHSQDFESGENADADQFKSPATDHPLESRVSQPHENSILGQR